ncbi:MULTISPECIES: YopX family protein [Bacillus]|uniref:YopX family protein n=1 Tax=Bacillus TaxID=1386 RepID=UPI0021B38D8D|nr:MULTISPECIES: YopX family protein [Bacillus]
MREIKCRGKDEEGQWHYGYYVFTNDMHRIIYEDRECFYCEEEVIPESVGQYTGVLDSRANEIYEGDIVKNAFGEEYKVIWDGKRCQFIAVTTIEDGSEWYQNMSRSLEIIGNIYEDENSTK